MKKGCKKPGCLIFLLLIVIAIAGLWWLMRQSPLKLASKVAPEILTFIEQPDVIIREVRQHETPYGKTIQFSADLDNGDSVIFDIDEDKTVIGFFRKNQTAETTAFSLEEANQIALEYARQHYSDITLLNAPPTIAERVNTQATAKYYRFMWTKKDEQSGAHLPQSVYVEVNASTGKVDSYSQLNQAITVKTHPTIEGQLAEQTAVQEMEQYLSKPTVTEAKLIVAIVPLFETNGEQTLLWQIKISGLPDETGYIPEVLVFVDAETGDLVQIEPLF